MRRHKTRLGRTASVVRETWRLADDPRVVAPRETVIASDWSLADAADLARLLASVGEKHGYDKRGGFWWTVDRGEFHRISVRNGYRPKRTPGLLAAAGFLVAGIAIGRLATARGPRAARGQPA